MLNFKSFRAAGSVLAGIELIHMIRKGQFAIDAAAAMSFADQFSTLAGMIRAASAVQAGSGEIPLFHQQSDRTIDDGHVVVDICHFFQSWLFC